MEINSVSQYKNKIKRIPLESHILIFSGAKMVYDWCSKSFHVWTYHFIIFYITYIYLDYSCSDYNQKCLNGLQCISEYSLCDGYEDCTDKSDEDPDVCRGMFETSCLFFSTFLLFCKIKCDV